MTNFERQESGCPFRLCFDECDRCALGECKDVTGFALCEFDWESCPDYKEILKVENRLYELAEKEAVQIYDVVKAVYPKHTTVNAGVDVHELVKSKFSVQYDKYFMNFLDWNDVDGVLDYLYGIRATHGADVSEIIKLIESNCGSAA